MRFKKWKTKMWLLVSVWFAFLLTQKALHYNTEIIWIIIYTLGMESAFINCLMSFCSDNKNNID